MTIQLRENVLVDGLALGKTSNTMLSVAELCVLREMNRQWAEYHCAYRRLLSDLPDPLSFGGKSTRHTDSVPEQVL